jgi:hypothetical protein
MWMRVYVHIIWLHPFSIYRKGAPKKQEEESRPNTHIFPVTGNMHGMQDGEADKCNRILSTSIYAILM